MTPGDSLAERSLDAFCERGVLAAINALADLSHSKAMADIITAGKWKVELLLTLGKVAPPRYANFIGRYKDDPDETVRRAVAEALGLIDNDAIAIPVLIQLLTRGTKPEDFSVRWGATQSLVGVAKRKSAETIKRRLGDLLPETDRLTVTLAARALAMLGDARGGAKLRDLTTDADPRVRLEAVMALGDARDQGSKDVLTRRLADESLAVRACAMYALGQSGDPSVTPALRQALAASLEYEKELERRKQRGESEKVLQEKFGLGWFDLRQTLEEAITQSGRKK